MLLLKRELSTENYKYVVWLDGDAAVLDHDKSLESFIHQVRCAAQRSEAFLFHLLYPQAKGRHLILQEDLSAECRVNCGVMIFRRPDVRSAECGGVAVPALVAADSWTAQPRLCSNQVGHAVQSAAGVFTRSVCQQVQLGFDIAQIVVGRKPFQTTSLQAVLCILDANAASSRHGTWRPIHEVVFLALLLSAQVSACLKDRAVHFHKVSLELSSALLKPMHNAH